MSKKDRHPFIPGRPYLKTSEVAETFGVNHSTVFQWVKKGMLKPLTSPGRNYRFDRDDVLRLAQMRDTKRFRDKRREPRFTVSCPGLFRVNGFSRPATITDISAHGLGIRLVAGEELCAMLQDANRTGVVEPSEQLPFKSSLTGRVCYALMLDTKETAVGISLIRDT